MNDTKSALAVCAIALTSWACATSMPLVAVRSDFTPNPTSWVFPLNRVELHRRIVDAYGYSALVGSKAPPFPRYAKQPDGRDVDVYSSLRVATKDHILSQFSRQLFSKPGREYDVLLNASVIVDTPSEVYWGKQGPLMYVAQYHLELSEVSPSETKVTVRVIDPRVVVEVSPWGWHSLSVKFESVKPTTIEEYRILRHIGNTLGAVDIPPVSSPMATKHSSP